MSNKLLPNEWSLSTLDKIADWGSGGTPSRKNAEYYNGDIPWIKTGDLGPRFITQASEYITDEAIKNSSAKFFKKGSVAIAMYGATIGKTSVLGIDATTNQACGVGQPIQGGTTTGFLYYLLVNEKERFIAKGKGGAQPNISQTVIKGHEIGLPPLAEQKQIAKKLDELLAQVDTIKTRLDTIPTILKRFRQSVLAAAVSGKLTKEWRKKNPNSEALKSCLKKTGSITGGKTPSKSNSAYWTSGTIPWVSPKDMKVSEVFTSKNLITELAISQAGMKFIPVESVLMVTRSGILAHTFPIALTKVKVTINQDIKAFVPDVSKISAKFTVLVLKGLAPNILFECSKTGTTVPSVGTELLENFEFTLPSLAEQTEITHQVEQLFDYADQIEQRVKDAQSRVNNLTQSILAKAFRGELTAEWREQNPDLISGENSSEALLEKIKAEREAMQVTKSKKKKKLNKKTAA